MCVIARIPRLESGAIGTRRQPPPADNGADAPGDPMGSIGVRRLHATGKAPPARERPRGQRRFTVVTTLLLAVAAATCWLAVWRQERRRDREESALLGAVPDATRGNRYE